MSDPAVQGSDAAPSLGLVWAQAHDGVIGKDGVMPWHVPEDLAHFKRVTLGGPVIMGRKTWDSLPPRFRPLPDRRNIVVTREAGWAAEGAVVTHSIPDALALAADELGAGALAWVIGGAEIFAAVIGRAQRLEVTEIDAAFDGDTFAPALDEGWTVEMEDPESGWHESRTGLRYRFVGYARRSGHAASGA